MPLKNHRIVEDADRFLVLFDRTDDMMLDYYSRRRASAGDATATTNAVACRTRRRAEAIAAMEGYALGQNVCCTRAGMAHGLSRLPDGTVLYLDRYGPDHDDADLKAMHPPPPGIDVEFHWTGGENVYRLHARTDKDGRVVTRTAVLRPGSADLAANIAKAYARFVRTTPAPRNDPDTLTWCAPMGELVRTATREACTAIDGWLNEIRATPISQRGVRKLKLPGQAFVGSRTTMVALETVPASNEIAIQIHWNGGHVLSRDEVRIHQALPETIVAAMEGRSGRTLFDAPGADAFIIGTAKHVKHAQDPIRTVHVRKASYAFVRAAVGEGVDGDEDASAALAQQKGEPGRNLLSMGAAAFLRDLRDDTVLLLVRMAALAEDHVVDVTPWCTKPATLRLEDGLLSVEAKNRPTLSELRSQEPLRGVCRRQDADL